MLNQVQQTGGGGSKRRPSHSPATETYTKTEAAITKSKKTSNLGVLSYLNNVVMQNSMFVETSPNLSGNRRRHAPENSQQVSQPAHIYVTFIKMNSLM